VAWTPTTLRSEFYEAYKRQAKIFNKELEEYDKELNVTLLLVSDPVCYLGRACAKRIHVQAALFAVVASTILGMEESEHLFLVWGNRQGGWSL